MAQIARMCGALLAHSNGQYFLVGHTAGNCDFAANGFEAPSARSGEHERRALELKAVAPVPLEPTVVRMSAEGHALIELLVERLLDRDGSVSEPLWNLLIGELGDTPDTPGELEADWFVQQPKRVWDAVRAGMKSLV